MLLDELILQEYALPAEASIQRRFDFASVDNRRFIFDPVSKRFVIGQVLPKGKGIYSSHSEEWFEATGSNNNFDRCARGWFGSGGNYRNGIIHFAPPVNPYSDAAYACIKAFIASGATAKTKLRGAPDMNEPTLAKEYPELFKLNEARLDELSRPSILQADMILINAGYKRLGNGSFGTVYGKEEVPYVLKLFTAKDYAYLDYVKLIKEHDNPHFPKILGKPITVTPQYYALRMERLQPYHGEITDILFYMRFRDLSDLADGSLTQALRDNALVYMDYHPKLKEACDLIIEELTKWSIDIKSDNVMLRGDTLVIIDPVVPYPR